MLSVLWFQLTLKKYAIKKIIKSRNTPSQMYNVNHPRRINTEINILQTLDHVGVWLNYSVWGFTEYTVGIKILKYLQPLIVGMEEIWETDSEVYIVLEYLEGGELSSRISSGTSLSESNAKFFFYQIALAVQYLHSKGITHRDLKVTVQGFLLWLAPFISFGVVGVWI